MFDLAVLERFVLEKLLARPPAPSFDGNVLVDLASRNLIGFGFHGWRVTPLGRAALILANGSDLEWLSRPDEAHDPSPPERGAPRRRH